MCGVGAEFCPPILSPRGENYEKGEKNLVGHKTSAHICSALSFVHRLTLTVTYAYFPLLNISRSTINLSIYFPRGKCLGVE